ncbi:leucine zipper putative tumor suppressor 2 homolog [Halyomorpha halys]|uniref:leucine zipper putative tumor suppressor 2 homolog n=1 Tax=Halyomorpha halys TaxID=286706 RepID=UPI0006D4F8ED|nr:leucine zipper putative tumor suppressor 2 homolog [Halyomorpha halys]XP_024215354.1 leucine zipper putative tumor suppressor 2 homolog [Halyomorpha halys]XP_024215355.1 leucine zipper putative tumor suppressor 2 homolog [Halyomorpha halys]
MSRVDSGNESQEGSPDTTVSEPPFPPRFSAALTQGKTVIRPVAFKPSALSSSRFSNCGHRYGSTPILARPASHLALYGSSGELWRERKVVSPPPAMSSLPSDCSRLHSYDSLDSVYKSATNTTSNRGASCELTPSPCDSATLAELEVALRERDSELLYLRQTMEANEQVIFRVYEEKERAWERELRRVRAAAEERLRAASQRASKTERTLITHTYQLQQEKKRLREEVERTKEENSSLHSELEALRTRLEETEWGLCQKSGELALVKAKLKEAQGEHATKGQETISLKTELRDTRSLLEKRELEVERLRAELDKVNTQLEKEQSSKEKLLIKQEELQEGYDINEELETLRETLTRERAEWEAERERWASEKERVLTYQKQLQVNYVAMYRRTRELEKAKTFLPEITSGIQL